MKSGQPGQRKTILLVDDDERLRDILYNFLEIKGFSVIPASSGEETLEQLRAMAPDAILLDVRMPGGMDGIATLKKIREIRPLIPVIMVTQVDEERARENALAAGANEYVLKPFSFEELGDLLTKKILPDQPA